MDCPECDSVGDRCVSCGKNSNDCLCGSEAIFEDCPECEGTGDVEKEDEEEE